MKIQAQDFLKQENLGGIHAWYAVAGGSLRDIILGKEIKDVDLFILPTNNSYMNISCTHPSLWVNVNHVEGCLEFSGVWERDIFKECEGWFRFTLEKQGEGESEVGEDFASYLCPAIPGLNVVVLGDSVKNVHGVTNDEQLIKYLFHSFPCNMSRVALNKDGLHVHDSFWDGMRDKQFVYDMSKIRNNYMERMMEKYPPPWKHDTLYTMRMSGGLSGIKSVPPSLWSVTPFGAAISSPRKTTSSAPSSWEEYIRVKAITDSVVPKKPPRPFYEEWMKTAKPKGA